MRMMRRREKHLLHVKATANITFMYDGGQEIDGIPIRSRSDLDYTAVYLVRQESKGTVRLHRIIRDAFEDNVRRFVEQEGYKNATWEYGNVDIKIHVAGDVTK